MDWPGGKISGVESTSDHVEATLKTSANEQEGTVDITLRGRIPLESFRSIVKIHTSEEARDVDVNVDVSNSDSVRSDPEQILILARHGVTTSRSVVLHLNSPDARIDHVENPVDEVRIDTTKLNELDWEIKYSGIRADATSDGKLFKVFVKTATTVEVITIPVRVVSPEGKQAVLFEREEESVKVGLDQTEALVLFHFSNVGEVPVVFKRINASCGCVKVSSDKNIYLPGEKGLISASVEIGNLQGRTDKEIVVETDDIDRPITKLLVHIMVPDLVEFSPTPYARWDLSADAAPQTFGVKITAPFPMRITSVKSWNSKVHATLKEITVGKEYEIVVWPTDTKDVLNDAVELLNDAKPDRKIWLLIHVKPKGES